MGRISFLIIVMPLMLTSFINAQSTFLSETTDKRGIRIMSKSDDIIDLDAEWTSGDTIIPSARYYAGSVMYERNDTAWLYIFGGDSTGDGTAAKTCSRYNLNTNTWELIAEMPSPARLNGTARLGDKLFSFGGFTSVPYDSAGDPVQPVPYIFEYDVNSDRWHQLTDLDSALYFLRGIGYNDSLLFLLGGGNFNISAHKDVRLVNVFSSSVLPATQLTTGVADGGAALADSGSGMDIYYIGGYISSITVSDSILRGKLNPGNPREITWKTIHVNSGNLRGRINAHEWGNENIIVAGGSRTAGFDADSTVYVFDAPDEIYSAEKTLPIPLTAYQSGTVISGIGGKIIRKFVITGGVTSNKTISNKTFIYTDTITATEIEEDFPKPEEFIISENFPNPFNPTTNIKYFLPENSEVKIRVFDILGNELRLLLNGYQEKGRKTIAWDGKDNYGRNVSSGIYLFRIEAGSWSGTRKMVLIR